MPAPLNLQAVLNFLLDTPMFENLDPSELSEIVHVMQVQHLRDGQVLYEAGTPGDAWFVVYDGQIEATVDIGDGTPLTKALGPRECFGEMAVLDGSPRSTTMTAAVPSTVFRFPRKAFMGLLEDGHVAAYKLLHQLALVLVGHHREITGALLAMLRGEAPETLAGSLAPIVGRIGTST